MRWIVIALLVAGAVGTAVPPAHAQVFDNPCDALTPPRGDPCQPVPTQGGPIQRLLAPDACADWAAQQALPTLGMAYAFSPDGYGPYGYGPLTQPLGPGAYGPATLYSPPGVVPVYGPLGPGETAAVLAAQAFPNGYQRTGMASQDFRNATTLLSLGGLQQSELANLYGRQNLAAFYQSVSASWVSAYSSQATAINTILRGLCHGIQSGAVPAGPAR